MMLNMNMPWRFNIIAVTSTGTNYSFNIIYGYVLHVIHPQTIVERIIKFF